MQEHLLSHFSSPSHNGFLNNVLVTFIDKTDPSDPLKREDYWKRTPKTMALFGLNIECLINFSGTSNSGHFRGPSLVAVALEVTVVGRF